jgi:hypothetical protein
VFEIVKRRGLRRAAIMPSRVRLVFAAAARTAGGNHLETVFRTGEPPMLRSLESSQLAVCHSTQPTNTIDTVYERPP